jgi:hypothetical protein
MKFLALSRVMSKAERKAYAKQIDEQRAAESHAIKVAEDLEALRVLRHYLVFKVKVRIPRDALMDAIDDYAGELTGDRTALHERGHCIP